MTILYPVLYVIVILFESSSIYALYNPFTIYMLYVYCMFELPITSQLRVNNILIFPLWFWQLNLNGGSQAICWRMDCPIVKALGRVTIYLCSSVLLLKVDVCEYNAATRYCVAASEFHGVVTFCSSTDVSVHNLAYLHCCCLHNRANNACGEIAVRQYFSGDCCSGKLCIPDFDMFLENHNRTDRL